MRRIGILNGKIIVQGDPNIVKPNEILLQKQEENIQLLERNSKGQLNTITGGDNKGDEDTIIIKGNDYYWKIDSPIGQDAEKYKKYQDLLNFLKQLNCVFSLIYTMSYANQLYYTKGLYTISLVIEESTKAMPSYVYNYIACIRECADITYGGIKANSIIDLLIKVGEVSSEQAAIEFLASRGLTKVTKEEFEEARKLAAEI